MRIEINDYIVADSNICHGKLTFNGTRVMVWQILEMLRDGAPFEEIINAFPSLTREHINAALQYAADIARGKENVIINIPFKD
ncbi:MAG: DUF433 domain-containing protein [Nanoarchaeota archaeon]|nr:DUF433 domain-containing protein [Nanoarchaeota archaeon]